MRIHQLTMSAFGPFAGTQAVDFEELNDAGVFLVTGPTGAGKTSILDAVCFALFGQVPGGRGVKALRSDHAEPQARPEVSLDFSVGGRRFVVRRSPEWARPKLRGEGTTPEKARASLVELSNGAEELLSSRAQEVGHFLSELLGMTAGQFQQVAMLPQGEFQTFLRATSQERHDVLQQLFRTERFTKIEDWVHDHSRALRAQAADGETAVRRLVDTIADRAGVPAPEALLGEALARSASDGQVLPWAGSLAEEAGLDLGRAAAEHHETTAAVAKARGADEAAVRQAELHLRRGQAREVLARLDDDAAVVEARALLTADSRTASCVPLLAMLDASLERQAAARDAQHQAAPEAHVDDPARALDRAAARMARLDALLPRERELHTSREALTAARHSLETLNPRVEHFRAAAEDLPARRRALTQRLEEAHRRAHAKPAAEAAFAEAESRAEAALAVPPAEEALAVLRDDAQEAREAAADARERMLDVIARRLSGMAAELAGTLADGTPCQVCGSVDHPAPARSVVGAVDESAQLTATAEAEALRRVHGASIERVQEAELTVARLRAESGGLSPESAVEAVRARRAAVEEAVTAQQVAAASTAALAALDAEAIRLAAQLRTFEDDSARLVLTIQSLEATTSTLAAELTAEIEAHPSVAAALAEAAERVRLLRASADATSALARADADVARLEEALAATAADAGFSTLGDARSAVLPEPLRTSLRRQIRGYDEARAEAEGVLADPALSLLPEEPPDTLQARAALEEALRRDAAAARAHHVCQERFDALTAQFARLEEALESWAPARERFLTADSMSRLVRGMGADNQLQLRLSAYVLATRLDQVVAAANERLTHMREQRYLLERTGDAARRGSQAGLGLRVVDEWTGETRDPATLSGGETFVVSLALALGLSDVVSAESGGVQFGTLFIDEGFGMLDLDTLDDVMDRLDGLRAGGRTVGVVSHVTELRNRIPTQLHVDKQRHGSSVSVTTLIA